MDIFELLYKNLEATAQVNGHLSEAFGIERGVKQGDALSCGLFVLAMDPLLRNIAANEHIEGVSIDIGSGELAEIKVLAYADDVTIICKNRDLQPIFHEYEKLSILAGLELNADKTEILNFTPSNFTSNSLNYLGNQFEIGRVNEVKICGIMISQDPVQEYATNVIGKIYLMEKIISSWGRRSLTMNGRMMLAKTFLLSQIVFVAQSIQIMPKEI